MTDADPRILRGIWLEHHARARLSLSQSQELLAHGASGPAFVWAVRAIEIFVRECLLFPHFYEQTGDLTGSFRKAAKVFGSGNWPLALSIATEAYGPLDAPLTETDEDAWRHWKRVAVRHRGDVVHGRTDASGEDAAWVQAYALRFMEWWAQRLAVLDRGPLKGVLAEIVESTVDAVEQAAG